MQLKGKGPAVGQQRQVKVLCIDNHASSNLASFLLRRCGYEVNCVKSIPDALDLIGRSSFDVYLINDELACGSGKELLNQVREGMAATPVLFYSTVIYPFSPRLADQSGSIAVTPVPVTEVAIAVNRTIGHALPLAGRAASVSATLAQRSRDE
jgi:DNA-binding NtrC family response regulator